MATVALPCVGVDWCTRALETMKVKFAPTNVYDLEEGYKDCLDVHYKEAGVDPAMINYHLGVQKGDSAQHSNHNNARKPNMLIHIYIYIYI